MGHGRLVLLAGEPGIGKSRLAEEVSNQARERGGASWSAAAGRRAAPLPTGPGYRRFEACVGVTEPACCARGSAPER